MAKSKPSGLAARFTLGSETPICRTICTVDGEVGTGKTYFGYTAPGPILSQNIDRGAEGVVEQFRKEGKEIYVEDYLWVPGDPEDEDAKGSDLQDLAKEIRRKWEKDLDYALENGIRTVIFDTESRIWQVFRYAEFGSPNAGNPRDYDALNQRFEAMINKVKATEGVNLILIRSMKDKWGSFGPTNKTTGKKGFGKGGREVWGYEHLAGMVFTELTFLYDEEEKEYKIQVGKCRHNGAMAFDTFPRMTFPELGTMMIEGSSEEDWA